ncbi:MAG: hypothetical protein AAB332_02975 [Planctomycetota bacterium]
MTSGDAYPTKDKLFAENIKMYLLRYSMHQQVVTGDVLSIAKVGLNT